MKWYSNYYYSILTPVFFPLFVHQYWKPMYQIFLQFHPLTMRELMTFNNTYLIKPPLCKILPFSPHPSHMYLVFAFYLGFDNSFHTNLLPLARKLESFSFWSNSNVSVLPAFCADTSLFWCYNSCSVDQLPSLFLPLSPAFSSFLTWFSSKSPRLGSNLFWFCSLVSLQHRFHLVLV